MLVSVLVTGLLVSFCGKALAAQEGDYAYLITDGKAQVTDYTGVSSEVSVPGSLGGAPVTSIGDYAFADCQGLRSVVIPTGVTTIGKGAFSGCSSLTSIKIPTSVTSIGDYAFADCTSLTAITLPKNASLMGEDTFKGCVNLTAISYESAPKTIYDQAFRRIVTANDGYSKIVATVTLPSRDKAEDLNITYNNGAASYNYFGCQRKGDDGSNFDFEFGFGFKPVENKMMQFGIYYSLKAGSGEGAIKEWNWMRPESGNKKFYGFDYGTTHRIELDIKDGKIRAAIYDENGNLEYSRLWSFPGPAENGTDQFVRRVTSLLVPEDKSASIKNYTWTSTDVGKGDKLEAANAINCKATISTSGDDDWITVVTGVEFSQETVSFDID